MRKRIILNDKPKDPSKPNQDSQDPRDIVKWKLGKQKDYPIDMFEERIVNELENNGQYSHNIISINLRMVEEIHGRKAANSIVNTFLVNFGWSPEPEI